MQEIVLRVEEGRKGRKARGKECGVVKEVRVIGKEKERGKEILVEKERGRPKEDTGEPQPGEKDIRGFVTSVEKRDTRLEKDCVRSKR